MSGGVDSSVAAALLKKRGFAVIGVFMKNWTPLAGQRSFRGGAGSTCTAAEDFESASAAAAALGIPLYSWNFEEEYRTRVFDYTLREYRAGRTPNPDVMCNKEIKFGVFFERAMAAGADFVATGHYARTAFEGGRWKLLAGRDCNKDQSYFLWTLTQRHLGRTLFPIGEYTKPEVRRLARTFGLPNADRPDSQGLCFVGKVDWRDFLSLYVRPRRGALVTTDGRVIGEHRGIEFYTVGQRRGIGIGGGTPYYIAAKDSRTNTLVVATADDPMLYAQSLTASDIHWIAGTEPPFPLRCSARIRYRQPLQACVVDGEEVSFAVPQRAAAAGQSIVFYRGDEVLGGGVIR